MSWRPDPEQSPNDLDISTALPTTVLFQLPSSPKLLSSSTVSQACDIDPTEISHILPGPDLQVRKWYHTIGAKELNQTYRHPHQTILLRPEVWTKEGDTFQKGPPSCCTPVQIALAHSAAKLPVVCGGLWHSGLSFMRPETSYTARGAHPHPS